MATSEREAEQNEQEDDLPQQIAQFSHQQHRARLAPLSNPQELAPLRLGGLSVLTDAQWEKIRPLLPKYVSHTRLQVADPRLIVEGILWVVLDPLRSMKMADPAVAMLDHSA
jgi:hypothetical protein